MSPQNFERLKVAAQRFAKALHEGGGKHILMGGGASILQGHRRETKDLDFDLAEMNEQILGTLRRDGIVIRPHEKVPNRWYATVPETSPGRRNATSVDVAVKDTVAHDLRFSKKIDGVTVANPHLLLVDKIRTLTTRSTNQTSKMTNDLNDVLFCASEIHRLNMPSVPDELQELLTDDIWKTFWEIVSEHRNDDTEVCEMFLEEYAGMKWKK